MLQLLVAFCSWSINQRHTLHVIELRVNSTIALASFDKSRDVQSLVLFELEVQVHCCDCDAVL